MTDDNLKHDYAVDEFVRQMSRPLFLHRMSFGSRNRNRDAQYKKACRELRELIMNFAADAGATTNEERERP